jgi:hypothetical protein
VIVEGEDGYRQAKEFMKLLMPSHARKVKQYADAVPLFQRAGVEEQLVGDVSIPVVQLKSGGYLVINPTEALVSIDINSGRSTREHNIEQTATQTNLEAAQEIARQLRLRDMAGLVVIDFIDMDHGSNVRKVEKAMKEALKNDRARIQVGRISAFGLMEMSRQRLRTGVLEASTRQCPHCEGTGLVRTASSAGLSALRLIEDEAARGRGSQIILRASQEAAFYLLNRKRSELAEIEDRYGVTIEVASDGELEGARMSVEAGGPPPAHAPRFERLIEEPEEDDYVERSTRKRSRRKRPRRPAPPVSRAKRVSVTTARVTASAAAAAVAVAVAVVRKARAPRARRMPKPARKPMSKVTSRARKPPSLPRAKASAARMAASAVAVAAVAVAVAIASRVVPKARTPMAMPRWATSPRWPKPRLPLPRKRRPSRSVRAARRPIRSKPKPRLRSRLRSKRLPSP